MAKVVTTVSLDNELLEKMKVRTREGGQTVSGYLTMLIDKDLGFSAERKEKEKEDRITKEAEQQKERKQDKKEDEEFLANLSEEERVIEIARRDRMERIGYLSMRGFKISNEMFRGEVPLPDEKYGEDNQPIS